MSRYKTTEALKVSLKYLRKTHGGLSSKEGIHNQTLSWNISGEVIGTVGYDLFLYEEPPYMLLKYDWNGRPIETKIEMEMTNPHLGGERFWFRCPITGRRCTTLYKPFGSAYFASREAHKLLYPLQCMSRSGREWEKLKRFIAW